MKKITRIEYDLEKEDLTIFFEDADEPFGESEFLIGSPTRNLFKEIKNKIRSIFEETKPSEPLHSTSKEKGLKHGKKR